MSSHIPDLLKKRGWWVSFVLLMVVALIFSTVVGGYVSQLRAPKEIGRSSVGEWADLSDHGFRARLDSMDLAPAFPRSFDPGEEMIAPAGTQYLRVRMSIEPLVGQDEDLGCLWKLFDGDGEQLTLTEFGVEGPASTQCSFLGEGSLEKGVAFESQEVYVVVPDAGEDYRLEVHASGDGARVYWTFTPSG